MELPDSNTPEPDDELQELIINTALEILAERAENGDEFSRLTLEEIARQLSEAKNRLSS